MPPDHVQEIDTRAALDGVVELMWEGWYRPFMPHAPLFFPVDGYEHEDDLRALAASKERIWSDFAKRDRDNERWIHVIDQATSQSVGCAIWSKLSGSPAPDGTPTLDFYWLKGAIKEFPEMTYQQLMLPRCLWMHRRHGDLSKMVVHPEHRGKGVGSLLMQYGNDFLDEDGLEGLIECTSAGAKLYEKWGYSTVTKIEVVMPKRRDIMWQKMKHDVGLSSDYGFVLWRPPYGNVKDGERTRPWL